MGRKGGKKSRGKRRKKGAGLPGARWTVARAVRRAAEEAGLDEGSWREWVVDRFGLMGETIEAELRDFVDRRGDELGPEWAGHALAVSRLGGRHADRALAVYATARQTFPPSHLMEMLAGDVELADLGHHRAARRCYLRATEVAPGEPWARYQLALCHHLLGLFGRAEADYAEALRLAEPRVVAGAEVAEGSAAEVAARSAFNSAVYRLARGERAEARRLVERALELMPDYPEAEQALDVLEPGLGLVRGIGRLLGRKR